MPPKEDYSYYDLPRKDVPLEELYGRWQIDEYSQVSGGVLVGSQGSETLVVDVDKRPELYEDFLEAVLETARRSPYCDEGEEGLLQAVFDVVQANIKNKPDMLREIVDEAGSFPDRMIGLSTFMEKGVGVCRHSAALSASITEALIGRGYMDGTVSFKVGGRVNYDDPNDHEGHAFVVVTLENGVEYVLDVAQDFYGTRRQAESYSTWSYGPQTQRFTDED